MNNGKLKHLKKRYASTKKKNIQRGFKLRLSMVNLLITKVSHNIGLLCTENLTSRKALISDGRPRPQNPLELLSLNIILIGKWSSRKRRDLNKKMWSGKFIK